jgi:hypothetical protein
MAKIRTIKPGFFTSEDVSELPLRARLTWIGLWTHCDDQGRAKDNVKLIKAAVWVLDDVSLRDVEEDLAILAEKGRIVRYEVDGGKYLAVTNWAEHQKIARPAQSRIPAPPGARQNGGTATTVPRHDNGSAATGQEGKGREGKGGAVPQHGDSPPPPRCPAHLTHPNPPACGKCKDARRNYEAWEASRPVPTPPTVAEFANAPRCEHGSIEGQCALCRRGIS